MKRFVNGEEVELPDEPFEIARVGDRLIVRTPEGAFSAVAVRDGDAILVSFQGNQYRIEERRMVSSAEVDASGELRSPMPGQIVDVRRAVGDLVNRGETVLVLEAMKTQQPFVSPFDGRVTKILVEKGDQVLDGAILAIVEKTDI